MKTFSQPFNVFISTMSLSFLSFFLITTSIVYNYQASFSVEAFVVKRSRLTFSLVHYASKIDHVGVGDDDNGVPTMDWLTDSPVMTGNDEGDTGDDSVDFPSFSMEGDGGDEFDDDDDDAADRFISETNPIPSTGISVADEMQYAQRDRYYSEVVPIIGLPEGTFAAQIVSSTSAGSYEAVRYLLRLSVKEEEDQKQDVDSDESTSSDSPDMIKDRINDDDVFVMVDVPPFSPQLVEEIRNAMKGNNNSTLGRLAAILITSEDAIHLNDDDNDDPAGVYSSATSSYPGRKQESDLIQWTKAFPGVAVIANRMDVPRCCRDVITQRLDGYGPWASTDTDATDTTTRPDQGSVDFAFVETGRPLVRKELHPDMAKAIMSGKMKPPEPSPVKDEGEFSNEAIRVKEEGKQVLAIYCPGRTNGSMCYVFPQLKLCASGYTVPLEDTREETNTGIDRPGPAMDFRGYITTSKAGVARQMKSARNLVNGYSDRFEILLPSRGDPYYLDGSPKVRQRTLSEIIDQYDKLGRVYEQLGIL
jgi:hypothetical protein